ncbi:MAG: hypothetical protein ABL966_10985, partial [Acidimicrobiales bacterium]
MTNAKRVAAVKLVAAEARVVLALEANRGVATGHELAHRLQKRRPPAGVLRNLEALGVIAGKHTGLSQSTQTSGT